jgi:hypothetical protein
MDTLARYTPPIFTRLHLKLFNWTSKPWNRGLLSNIVAFTLQLGTIRDRGDLGPPLEQVPTILGLLYVRPLPCHSGGATQFANSAINRINHAGPPFCRLNGWELDLRSAASVPRHVSAYHECRNVSPHSISAINMRWFVSFLTNPTLTSDCRISTLFLLVEESNNPDVIGGKRPLECGAWPFNSSVTARYLP